MKVATHSGVFSRVMAALHTSSLGVRTLLAAAYLTALPVVAWCSESPRILWTVVLPSLPVLFVVAGFHRFRRACPLAALASFGASSRSARLDRIPPWLSSHAPSLMLALLAFGLVLRHVAINGDRTCLAVFLGLVALIALIVNRRFGGRAWCHYFCPVGLVERIYTDPIAHARVARSSGPEGRADNSGPQSRADNSACATCTGCIASCADIDQVRARRRSADASSRWSATLAFPGLVFAFYAYFPLRHGSWDAFFGGEWTKVPFHASTTHGETLGNAIVCGLTCTVVLITGMVVSRVVLGLAFEALGFNRSEEGRERALLASAALALAIFYLFAGQPTLRLSPIAYFVGLAVEISTLIRLVRGGLSRSHTEVGGSRTPRAHRHLPVVG